MNTDRSASARVLREGDGRVEVPPGHFDMTASLLHGEEKARVQLCRMEGTGKADPHVHSDETQVFVVLDGVLIMHTVIDPDGATRTLKAKAGEAIFMPAGVVHASETDGAESTYYAITFKSETQG
jgi:quercetin dioxygenase-like cupin family protein